MKFCLPCNTFAYTFEDYKNEGMIVFGSYYYVCYVQSLTLHQAQCSVCNVHLDIDVLKEALTFMKSKHYQYCLFIVEKPLTQANFSFKAALP